MALFLFAGGAFTCVTLMVQASLFQQQSIECAQAVRFGQQCQDAVRVWASDSDNFIRGTLYNDASVEAPEYPGHSARIQTSTLLYAVSPNQSLEEPYGALQRQIPQSRRDFKVTVRWGGRPSQRVTLYGILGAPLRELRPAPAMETTRVSGASSPMPLNATAHYQVELKDTSGNAIPGVTFGWTMVPEYIVGNQAGLGSLNSTVDRAGRRVGVINHYNAGDPHTPSAPGWVRLRVVSRYGGKEVTGVSDPIQLLP